ncbi:hypothetical protein POSPLADRAFT_1063125 [Postia placenta MAD-698-R-SB12]|uniref:Uncharacterized protein n=1 Tax=Postia placenta MAD-698-R-SB12 TaxID=670580 RepID=A0A1X6MIC9_9APHY|nr:hypothetical protein POSPLADRAFT_1063125 [Postia placenta MAD-698-R-SB12]OSX55996.1 hypothetical protein POSPLADRAFT_1063125 [Postia placenta MAD-698-R-SB12]
MSTTKPSEGPNIHSALAALLHCDLRPDIPSLSLPAPAYPNWLLVQVKHKEPPISLQTLLQSQSLRRVKKESWSLSLQFSVNTALATVELQVQVALSLLNGDACTWATPIFAQLASVTVGVQGVVTPFTTLKDFLTVFKGHFSNLDNATAAQVELTKLCGDKSLHEKCTAAEFSTLLKGPVDHSGYGDLELRNKYLHSILSQVYQKIELAMFTMWKAADKCATERKEDVAEHVVVHADHKVLQPASMRLSEKETFPAVASAAGSKGIIVLSSTQAATSTPVMTSPSASISAASANTKLAALMVQVKSMHEELEHYWAMKEESF